VKILILGASGLIGWNLFMTARSMGHEVVGTFRSYRLPDLIPLDLKDKNSLMNLFTSLRPEVTYFCGGWSWVDGCESDPQRAYDENAEQPACAADCAGKIGSHFTYFSSSYVFDGLSGPYDECARLCPISVYGNSKKAGEEKILDATGGSAVIARTMGVYGPEPQRKNFVFQVRQALTSSVTLKVPNDQFGNITYAPDLAKMAFALAEQRQSGIWNLAGSDPYIRRSDFALQIAAAYGLRADLIEPVETSALNQSARRPRQGGLLVDKIARFTSFEFQDWVKIP
jgi:dTDP-4-dehydrorhamnose reductase